jgi:L-alanine-DL-glutamate epimerase-like enolase superfamily enzyme
VTSYTIGIDTPEIVAEKIREAEGFPVLKIKMGLENDREIMETVRAHTNRPVRIDANEGWTRDEALEKMRWLEGLNVELVEQPLPAADLEGVRWLAGRTSLPIFADESVRVASDVPKLAGAFHGINIKLMKCGGIREALRMIHTARACGMKVMLGCMIESSIGITAAAHLSPLADYADLDGNLLIRNDPATGVTALEGKLVLPEGPGLALGAFVVAGRPHLLQPPRRGGSKAPLPATSYGSSVAAGTANWIVVEGLNGLGKFAPRAYPCGITPARISETARADPATTTIGVSSVAGLNV